MPARPLSISLAALLTLRTAAATAQVNAERLRADLAKKPLFATVTASFTGRVGNTNGVVTGASLFTGLLEGKHLLFLRAEGAYETSSFRTTVAKSFAHLRYNYELLPWLAGEAFTQAQQDRFERLRLRWLLGVGPRFGLLKTEDFDLHYGTSYMLEHERIDPAFRTADGGPSWTHRWNNYLAAALKVDQEVRFTNATYFQPRFDELSDWRLLSESAFDVDFAQRLVAKLSVVLSYDTRPAEDVDPLQLEVQNSLGLRF